MVGIVAKKWWFDGAAEELNVLPIQATPTPPAGGQQVFVFNPDNLFDYIEIS